MSSEKASVLEILLLYLRLRLASGDIAGAQTVADEITATLKREKAVKE